MAEEERDEYKKGLSAGVNVLAGYGTVFFVRPKETRFNSVISNDATRYEVRNSGNSTVVVDEFRNCSAKDESDCQPTTKHHVLPGRAFTFDKQSGREYNFMLIEGKSSKPIEVKG